MTPLLLLCLLPNQAAPAAEATPARSAQSSGAEWTSFLGPPQTLAARSAESLPLEWTPEQVAYTIDLEGYGQSSPVVHGGQIYVTTVEGPNKETCRVAAYALEDGRKLWTQDTENPMPVENNVYVSRAAPTPAADDRGVVAFFEGLRLVAYTPEGTERWNRDLAADYGPGEADFGLSASLAQDAAHVFVHVETKQSPYLLAVAKATGETVWKVPGLDSSTWASPLLIEGPEGSPHLVVSAKGSVAGFDPETGERLWRLDGLIGNTSNSPYPAGGSTFLIGGSGGRMDPDGPATNALFEITKQSDGFACEKRWEAERGRSSFGSPVAADGLAYFVNRSGAVFAYDLETGEPAFTKRVAESSWATPLVIGSRIYFVGKDGETTVVGTGPDFETIGGGRVWPVANEPSGRRFGSGPLQYAGVAAGDTLLIRAGQTLYAVRK